MTSWKERLTSWKSEKREIDKLEREGNAQLQIRIDARGSKPQVAADLLFVG